MTKEAAIHSFFSSFGLDRVFEESSVPSGTNSPEMPYLTYSVYTDCSINSVPLTCSLWYRSTSWVGINSMTESISAAIGTGRILPCDGGAVLIRRGTPFAQSMSDSSNDTIKRKYITLEAKFITTY